MTRTFTLAVGSVLLGVGLLSGQGCLVKIENGDTGGGAGTTTGSNTTGSDTTSTSATSSATTGSGVLPSSCDARSDDDSCTACEKKSCCAELEACSGNAACGKAYDVYSECLFPSGVESGYTSTYCQAVAGESDASVQKDVEALITCLTTTCGTDTACGTPQTVTWNNFAADFSESFCNGCHFPGFSGWNANGVLKSVGPGPEDIPQFSDDADWQSVWNVPKGNPDWKSLGRYDLVSDPVVSAKIWCGVSTTLPDQCATDFPGHFNKAKRFPPAGVDPNDNGPSCVWTSDGSCPQPTDFQRNQMASWVFDGTPQ